MGKSRQGERQNLEHLHLLGISGGMLSGPQAKDGLVNSNQRSGVLVSSMGSYLRLTPRKALGSYGHFYHRATGKLTFPCDPIGCYLGYERISI